MEPRTWLHILLLVGSLVGFGMMSWALNREKIAEYNNHTSPTASDQAVAFVLGFGWWAAFCVAYWATWRYSSNREMKHRFGIVVLVMTVFFVGIAGVFAGAFPASSNVYVNYGLSFLGPVIFVILLRR